MNTLEFVLNKYQVTEQPVIKLQCSRWGSLTRLFRHLGYKVGVEVGVERGRYSKILCQQNPQCKLYGVDPWQTYEGYRDHVAQDRLDEFFAETKARMGSFNYQIIRDFSVKAAKRFADESLDFVYIDAAHDYQSAKEDIEAWHPKVRAGGIVAGHDYMNGNHTAMDKVTVTAYGVKQAVNEWIEKNQISPLFLFTKDKCPSWMYVK